MYSFTKGEYIAKISLGIFAIIGTIELVFGIVSGSIALMADGIHIFADGMVSFITLLGLKIARRAPNGRFHFGYYKTENFSAIVSALIMVVVALFIVYRSYLVFMDPHQLTNHIPSMLVALIASLVFGLLGLNKRKIAKQIRSRALWFDAFNTLKSSVASFTAFLGILLSYFGFFQADPIAGIMIGSIIFIVAYITIKESSLTLLDACTCVDVIETIKKTIRKVEGVKDVENIRLRGVGPFIIGEATIKVNGEMTIYELNKITRKIQEIGKNQIDNLIGLIVEAKPVNKTRSSDYTY